MKGIVKEIYDAQEKIFLIYAFNATGKTRLSVEYKNYSKALNGGEHAGVYYNAYSEDLFRWNNDEENDNQDIRLEIVYSSLNEHHANLNEDLVLKKLAPYKPKYKFFFTPVDESDPEKGFGSVSFFLEEDEERTPIKISRGEERIFIWCFFLALFEVEGWSDKQNQHFFIDDPVSSMDDHNIFITAHLLLELLKENCEKRKIIITTHHMGIFSILQDWLKKGENTNKFKYYDQKIQEEVKDGEKTITVNKVEKNRFMLRFLEVKDGKYKLVGYNKGIHLYHLLLLRILKDAAAKQELKAYHFVLLRQVLESVASFLGEGRFGYVLNLLFNDDDDADKNLKADVINALSHEKIYSQKLPLLTESNRNLLETVLDRLIDNFHFSI